MISIFYRSNSASSKYALSWFERYGIEYEKKKMSMISEEELRHLLALTETGFEEIIKSSSKIDINTYKNIKYMENLTFNEAVEFLLSHTDLFRNPIILAEKNYMIGYNDAEIRRFFPKEYRFRKYRTSKLY